MVLRIRNRPVSAPVLYGRGCRSRPEPFLGLFVERGPFRLPLLRLFGLSEERCNVRQMLHVDNRGKDKFRILPEKIGLQRTIDPVGELHPPRHIAAKRGIRLLQHLKVIGQAVEHHGCLRFARRQTLAAEHTILIHQRHQPLKRLHRGLRINEGIELRSEKTFPRCGKGRTPLPFVPERRLAGGQLRIGIALLVCWNHILNRENPGLVIGLSYALCCGSFGVDCLQQIRCVRLWNSLQQTIPASGALLQEVIDQPRIRNSMDMRKQRGIGLLWFSKLDNDVHTATRLCIRIDPETPPGTLFWLPSRGHPAPGRFAHTSADEWAKAIRRG